MIFVPFIELWAGLLNALPSLLPAYTPPVINTSAVEIFAFLIKWNWIAPVNETMFIFGFMVLLWPILVATKFFTKIVDWLPFKFS
jgi:hypothetical protein